MSWKQKTELETLQERCMDIQDALIRYLMYKHDPPTNEDQIAKVSQRISKFLLNLLLI
jgi:hypothetical protein